MKNSTYYLNLSNEEYSDLVQKFKSHDIPNWDNYIDIIPKNFIDELIEIYIANAALPLTPRPIPIAPKPTRTPPPKFIKDGTHLIEMDESWAAFNESLVNEGDVSFKVVISNSGTPPRNIATVTVLSLKSNLELLNFDTTEDILHDVQPGGVVVQNRLVKIAVSTSSGNGGNQVVITIDPDPTKATFVFFENASGTISILDNARNKISFCGFPLD